MEQAGHIIKSIGTLLKACFKILLYLSWGLSRVLETTLHELNGFLKAVLEKKPK